MKLKSKMFFTYFLLLILILYLLIVFGLFFFQKKLLYNPVENNYYSDKLEVPIEKVTIKTSDDIKLLAWYHKKDISNYKTILFLHGNAGSLENRIHKINHFKNMNINFLLLAWRGFSGNEGQPTEQGLYDDAKSAVKWLINQGVLKKNIIIYGESLGTGVASEIAQNAHFAAVILESPFTSMVDVGSAKYPIFPINLLLKDKYENNKKVKNIISPILVMHGEKDQIVPFWMGKKIYNLSNEPKYSYFSKYDNHMMEYNEELLSVLKKFIQSLN